MAKGPRGGDNNEETVNVSYVRSLIGTNQENISLGSRGFFSKYTALYGLFCYLDFYLFSS